MSNAASVKDASPSCLSHGCMTSATGNAGAPNPACIKNGCMAREYTAGHGPATPFLSRTRAEQVRRVVSSGLTAAGLFGMWAYAALPEMEKLFPHAKWIPFAVAALGKGFEVWQKVQDTGNIAEANLSTPPEPPAPTMPIAGVRASAQGRVRDLRQDVPPPEFVPSPQWSKEPLSSLPAEAPIVEEFPDDGRPTP